MVKRTEPILSNTVTWFNNHTYIHLIWTPHLISQANAKYKDRTSNCTNLTQLRCSSSSIHVQRLVRKTQLFLWDSYTIWMHTLIFERCPCDIYLLICHHLLRCKQTSRTACLHERDDCGSRTKTQTPPYRGASSDKFDCTLMSQVRAISLTDFEANKLRWFINWCTIYEHIVIVCWWTILLLRVILTCFTYTHNNR